MPSDSTVKQPDNIANKLFSDFGYSKFNFQFGTYGTYQKYIPLGYKLQVSYLGSGHWVAGNINLNTVYNSANSIGKYIDQRGVFLYAK